MATHSGILAWKIPWTEEPGKLKSIESPTVRHNWATNTFTFIFLGGSEIKNPSAKRLRFDPWVRKIPWRRAWQPTPMFLPGDSQGQRRAAGCSPQDHKELDTTEAIEYTWGRIDSFVTNKK